MKLLYSTLELDRRPHCFLLSKSFLESSQLSMSYCGGLVVGGAVHDQRDLLTFRAVSETLLPNTSRLELSGPTITQSLIYKTVYTFLKYIKLLSPHCNIGYGQ